MASEVVPGKWCEYPKGRGQGRYIKRDPLEAKIQRQKRRDMKKHLEGVGDELGPRGHKTTKWSRDASFARHVCVG